MKNRSARILTLLLAMLLFMSACSPKGGGDKEKQTKERQGSSAPINKGSGTKPNTETKGKTKFYNLLSKEEMEQITGMKVVGVRKKDLSYVDRYGHQVFFAEKNAMPLPEEAYSTAHVVTIYVFFSNKVPREEGKAVGHFNHIKRREKENETLKELSGIGEAAFSYTRTTIEGRPVGLELLAMEGKYAIHLVQDGLETASLDLLKKFAEKAMQNGSHPHDKNTFENLEQVRPCAELSEAELRERITDWYNKVEMGMSLEEVQTLLGMKGEYVTWEVLYPRVYFTDMSGKNVAVYLTKDGKVLQKEIMLNLYDWKDYARLTPDHSVYKPADAYGLRNVMMADAIERLGSPGLEVGVSANPNTPNFEKKKAIHFWFNEDGGSIRAEVHFPANQIFDAVFFDGKGKPVSD